MTEPRLDIHEEILVRLQVNDLIRCKSVCKSWNSLIKSPRFVKSHLNNIVKKKVDNNEIGDTRIIALGATSMCDDDCRFYRRHECQVVGSSNGLVCISRYVTEFLVVNPSTRKVKQLRNPLGEYNSMSACVSGFGYDSSIDDYKVVIGFRNSKKLVFAVLTLKSNVWRAVAVESGFDYLSGNGILCNGAIHWYAFSNNNFAIVSFDLSKEVFKEIPLPKLVRSNWDFTLGTMKDCLCIFASPNINFRKNEDIEIWVMRSYNVQESWERKLPPPGYNTQKTMMHYIPQEGFFNHHVHIWLLEEGICAPVLVRSIERPHHELRHCNAHIRLSTNSECNYNYDHHVFVKSLVSPHGMGDGDGDGDGDGGNINDVFPDEDKIKELAEEYMEHLEHGKRTRIKNT
ncbi:F-box protein CPR1-like protein [Tanacetum coccineum]